METTTKEDVMADYTDSIAHAIGALRAARAHAMDACIELPRDTPDWEDTDEGYTLLATVRSLRELRDFTTDYDALDVVMDVNRGRIARWGFKTGE